MKIFKKLTCLGLACLLVLSTAPLGAAAQTQKSIPIGTSTTAPPLGLSMTPFALEDYDPSDVAVINKIINDNGLVAALSYPDGWFFATWDNSSTPKRLTKLRLQGKNLKGHLDVSGLNSLEELKCSDNQLTSLTVSGLSSLEELYCNSNNQLTSLTVSGLPSLRTLNCTYNNRLTSLDVSGLTSLTSLDCSDNQLTSLTVRGLTNLTSLKCSYNRLTSLEVSGLNSLTSLNCSSNRLTSLIVTDLPSLTLLNCSSNQLTSLTVSGLNSLTRLNGNNNQLTNLEVSGLTSLEELYCNSNQLTSLEVSGLNSLERLECYNNQLTSLEVSGLTSLTLLNCNNNQLTSLEVSGLTNLEELNCYNNQLTSLDVNGLTSLTWLDCSDNQLTSLTVSGLTRLTRLYCNNNQLTSLTVSGLTSLARLYCSSNQLTSLEVSGLTNLEYLYCNNNSLTSLDVSELTSLEQLDCRYNYMPNRAAVNGIDGVGTVVFDPQNTTDFLGVKGINNLPNKMAVGFPLTLEGNVFPTNATNQTIVWRVTAVGGTGATITGNSLTATASGTASIKATITGGLAPTVAYTQSFNIRVVPADRFFSPLVVDGGSGSGNYHAGKAVTITASPATGQVFKEWQTTPAVDFDSGTDEHSSPASFAMPASAVTATAMYDTYYEVTLQTDGNGSAVASKTSALAGESIALTAIPHTGYRFKEWQVVSGGVTIVNNTFIMPDNLVTVKAIFELIPPSEYAVTVQTDGNGSAVANKTSALAGESIDLTATPSTGYRFKEWQVVSGGVTIVNNTFIMPDNLVTVKAIFELIPPSEYAVTVQTDGNGSAVANKTSALAGESIALTATPSTGYRFKEWQVVSGGVTIVNNTFIMPNNPVTVKAVFELIPPSEYAVTLQTDGNGSAVASKTSAPAGESIDLTATPSTGYRLKEWQVVSGGVTIVNNSFIMPNNPVTVKAIFELIPPREYAVTVQTDGNGSAVASKTSALAGESIALTATPSTGYRFKEWQVVSGGVTIVNNSFVMPNNLVTVKAIFEVTPTTPPVTGTTTRGVLLAEEGLQK